MVRTDSPEVAQQAAITLALLEDEKSLVYCDSKRAILFFGTGSISPTVGITLGTHHLTPNYINWFPVQMGQLEGLLAVTTRVVLETCASIKTSFPEVVEGAAIALALAQPKVGRIVTDSQKAYNNYRNGWVSLAAVDILKSKRDVPERKVEFIWTPAHSGLEGNELAHQFAREMEHRVEEGEPQPILSYRDITNYYKTERRRYPDPHKSLSREQQAIYRQIQAGSFPHPYLQNKMYPERYEEDCNFCKTQLGTLQHVIGVCDFIKAILPPLNYPATIPLPSSTLTERWETLLTSTALEDQLVLISRGQAAREAYGSREEGTTSIDGV
ncbi:uncharacterized protein [Dermacentor albipictus]|uniref:uncharacterized protein n=1 Tax=Dermacentor albipictus TaxID=60249 RepID=UPI0038FC3360